MAGDGWGMFRLDICLGYLLQDRRGNIKSFEMEVFSGNVWKFLIKMRKRHSRHVSAFTAIGLFVFLCTLAGDTSDYHPVVMAFT